MTPSEEIVTGQSYSLDNRTQFTVVLDTPGRSFNIAGTATRTDTSIGTTEFTVSPAIDMQTMDVTGATGSPSVIAYIGEQSRDRDNKLVAFNMSINQSTSVVFNTISGCTITWAQ